MKEKHTAAAPHCSRYVLGPQKSKSQGQRERDGRRRREKGREGEEKHVSPANGQLPPVDGGHVVAALGVAQRRGERSRAAATVTLKKMRDIKKGATRLGSLTLRRFPRVPDCQGPLGETPSALSLSLQ